jgi:hypothetical protein
MVSDASNEEPSDPPVSLAEAHACLALGRLDGALAYASADSLSIFSVRSIRRALQASLAAAGHPVRSTALADWIARAGASPIPDDTRTRVGPETLVAVILAHLQRWEWPPLADAAARVARAAPHLLTSGDRNERIELGAIIDSAAALFDAPFPAAGPPFAGAITALGAARTIPDFVDSERAVEAIAGPQGPVTINRGGAIGHVWALGLALAPALAKARLSAIALPLLGAVPRRSLHITASANAVTTALGVALTRAANTALADLAESRRLARVGREGLAATRRQSRAFEAWVLIAGLGAIRRTQIAAALAMTPAGADQALGRLVEAGLIARDIGDPRGPFRPAIRRGRLADPAPVANPPHDDASAEVEAALAEIDRILAKGSATGPKNRAARMVTDEQNHDLMANDMPGRPNTLYGA